MKIADLRFYYACLRPPRFLRASDTIGFLRIAGVKAKWRMPC